MRLSSFWQLMAEEFGAGNSKVLARDLVLGELDHRTATEAIEAGVDPRTVWFALCRAQDVPENRWWGADRPPRD